MVPDEIVNGGSSRRQFLQRASCGFGFLALADLCTRAAAAAEKSTPAAAEAAQNKPAVAEKQNPLAAKPPHFQPRAKRVIFMFMAGAPSHVDTFDYKPRLEADNGKPASKGNPRKLLKSPFKFSQHGKSGLWFPETLPNLAKHADDLCVLNSMHTDLPAHPQATIEMHTGNFRFSCALRWAHGCCTAWGPRTRSCPASSRINPGGIPAPDFGSAFLAGDLSRERRSTARESDGGTAASPTSRTRDSSPQLQRKQLDLRRIAQSRAARAKTRSIPASKG